MSAARQRGQATVELALCLPVVCLVLAGLFEASLVVVDRVRLEHAAREAARAAVVDPDPAAARAALDRAGMSRAGVALTPGPRGRVAGEHLTATVMLVRAGRVPVVGLLFGGIRLTATATMRIEVP